jgi:hypothetical protein
MAVNTLKRGLNRETRALLEYIQRERPANLAYGKPAQTVIVQAHATIDRVIASSGLAHLVVDELHWFMDDVARALVAGQGEELVFELEGLLGKWLAYDLEPNTVQLLLRILLRQVAGIEVPNETIRHESTKNTKRRSSKTEGRSTEEARRPNGGVREDSTTKAPRHEEDTSSDTGTLALSDRGRRGQPSTPGIPPSVNDERRTGNDERTAEVGDVEAGDD